MDGRMGSGQPTRTMTLVAGIGIGAALMYFLDPARGRRRRALVRDQATGALDTAGSELRDRAADVRNRARGAAAELRNMGDDHPTNDQLEARVGAELGHHVERAHAIEVVADEGTVTLRGSGLRDELDDVLSAARGVRGVERVQNQLHVHATPDDAPSLQGHT